MTVLNAVSGPVIGAVIGYITNYIAIKMLFRPLEPVYLFGRRLPFTPGIVPRRKDKLAKILGDAVVERFFNADDLEVVFTSDTFADAVAEAMTDKLLGDDCLAGALELVPDNGAEQAVDELCIRTLAGLCASDLPQDFARKGRDYALGALEKTGIGRAVKAGVAESLEEKLKELIVQCLADDGYGYIRPVVHAELARMAALPMGELTAGLGADREMVKAGAKRAYMSFIREKVRPIVESIDVGGMITDKIVLMSAAEVETLVLAVVDRELHLVVLFGAVIGAVIGAVNIFI